MSDIIKKEAPTSIQLNRGKLRSTSSPFQSRVNQAKREEVDPTTMPNRLVLMLDKSSSMSAYESVKGQSDKRRIDLLKDALQNFISRCNFKDTAIAIETFPESFSLALSSNESLLQGSVFAFDAGGSTPMRHCVEACLSKIPMTRAIIVSDGEATDWHWDEEDGVKMASSIFAQYKEQSIPIDCVHISNDSGGEELLRRIARGTGGIFIKFTDVGAFAQAFGYLSPGYRAMLSDGRVSAAELGAREVR